MNRGTEGRGGKPPTHPPPSIQTLRIPDVSAAVENYFLPTPDVATSPQWTNIEYQLFRKRLDARPVAKGGHFGAVPPRWIGVPPRWMFPPECLPLSAPPLNSPRWVPLGECPPAECRPPSAPSSPPTSPVEFVKIRRLPPPRTRKTSPTTLPLEFVKPRRLPPPRIVKPRRLPPPPRIVKPRRLPPPLEFVKPRRLPPPRIRKTSPRLPPPLEFVKPRRLPPPSNSVPPCLSPVPPRSFEAGYGPAWCNSPRYVRHWLRIYVTSAMLIPAIFLGRIHSPPP